ncbi:MAG: hypothetical protein APR54_06385 [Candidatus Cloacimonas sp. SDB]|nr:MAG: hypothetical protein APR54_06385 [Candidatus Cloacimonas sp. SDB]
MTTMNKLENGRAEYSYEMAEEGKRIQKEALKIHRNYYFDHQYKSYVKKTPMFIKTNGLGATIAFMLSKKNNKIKKGKKPGEKENPKNAYDLIYMQISYWFKDERNIHKFDFDDFSKELCKMDSQQYRAITTETLALFSWLRRFAEGLIEGDSNDG